MVDVVSQGKRSKMMSGIKGKNTKPELIVRQILHTRGYRYRLHKKELPGKPDLTLSKYKCVVLVNGCFWHGHDCHLFRWPATREDFWRDKIQKNKVRDSAQIAALLDLDWRVVLVWECGIKGRERLDRDSLAEEIEIAVSGDAPFTEIKGRK